MVPGCTAGKLEIGRMKLEGADADRLMCTGEGIEGNAGVNRGISLGYG